MSDKEHESCPSPTFEITNINGKTIIKVEGASTIKEAVVKAVRQGADLRGAYLRGADFQGAYLRGAYLQGADLQGAYLRGAYLQGADFQGAYLRGAYLRGAYLQGADFQGAYLRGADFQGADLQGADLQGADLQGAYLRGARGVNKYLTTPLYILKEQPGPIRLYKLVTANLESPIASSLLGYAALRFDIGSFVEVKDASIDETIDCAPGVNVATADWCIQNWKDGNRILIVEFTAADIACIPIGSDGKIRLYRCRVVGEKNIADFGLGVPTVKPEGTV